MRGLTRCWHAQGAYLCGVQGVWRTRFTARCGRAKDLRRNSQARGSITARHGGWVEPHEGDKRVCIREDLRYPAHLQRRSNKPPLPSFAKSPQTVSPVRHEVDGYARLKFKSPDQRWSGLLSGAMGTVWSENWIFVI